MDGCWGRKAPLWNNLSHKITGNAGAARALCSEHVVLGVQVGVLLSVGFLSNRRLFFFSKQNITLREREEREIGEGGR